MTDAVYIVCYDGHQIGVLFVTTNEAMAITEAQKEQGFRVEKWQNGRKKEHRYKDFSIFGKDRIPTG